MSALHLGGKGVIRDYVYAYMWANIAMANGYEPARDAVNKLPATMLPAQVAEAQKLAAECVKKEYKNC